MGGIRSMRGCCVNKLDVFDVKCLSFKLEMSLGPNKLAYRFDVFSTVHHSIGYFLEPTLMHTSI